MWFFLGSCNYHVAEVITEFVHCIANGSSVSDKKSPINRNARAGTLGRLSANNANEPWLAEFDIRIIVNILKQMRYPNNFRVGADDDHEIEFLKFRKLLVSIYHSIARSRPEIVLQILANQLTPSGLVPIERIDKLPYADTEAFLTLIFEYAVSNKTKTSKCFDFIVAVHKSNVCQHSHHSVVAAYLEVTERYSFVLERNQELIPKILDLMLNARGLHFPHATVRARASYLISKLVKKLGATVKPYCSQLMQGVQSCINIPYGAELPLTIGQAVGPGPLRFSDQLHLFELAGGILSADWLPNEAKLSGMQILVAPLLQQIRIHVKQKDSDINGSGLWISRAMIALASLTKGFTPTALAASPGITQIFHAVCKASVESISAMPRHLQLRHQLMILMHRMIVLLGTSLIPMLPSILTILTTQHPEDDQFDAFEVLQLVTRIASITKQEAAPVIDPLLMRICQFVFQVVPRLDDPSDAKTLRKCYYRLLKTLVENNLSSVLVSPVNGQHLNSILDTILQGCSGSPEFAKVSFTVFTVFVKFWLPQQNSCVPPTIRQAFLQFVCEKITPVIFECVMQSHFDVKDAVCNKVLGEISKFLKAAYKCIGVKYTQYFQQVIFPQMSCPNDLAREFCSHITNDEPKILKKFLRDFFEKAQPEKYAL